MSDAEHLGLTTIQLTSALGKHIDRLKAELDFQIEDNWKLTTELMVSQDENAKLRELVRELWEGYNDPRCEECQLKDTPTCADCPICAREALVIDRMRELGIEVDE